MSSDYHQGISSQFNIVLLPVHSASILYYYNVLSYQCFHEMRLVFSFSQLLIVVKPPKSLITALLEILGLLICGKSLALKVTVSSPSYLIGLVD